MSKFLDETGLAYFWNKIKAALSTVAFTGSYNDLSNKPNIPASSTVDTALSSTSENPVQNKVINTALGTKANDSDVVKLTGDQTIAGTKTFSSGVTISTVAAIKREANNDHITIYGCTGYGNGAYLTLYGKDASTLAGKFTLRASDGTNNKDLTGLPDGTLQWGDKAIAIDENVVHLTGTETITGTKTFTANPHIEKAGPVFYFNRIYEGETPTDVADIRFQNNGTSEAVIRLTIDQHLQFGVKGSGANWYNGPALLLKNDNTFLLRSGYGGTTYALVGSTDGNLTWKSKVIAIDENVVHLAGDEIIGGNKTFSSRITLNGPMSGRGIDYVANTLVKGNNPSSDQSMSFYFFDKNGYNSSQNNCFGFVGIQQLTNSGVRSRLVAYQNVTGSTTTATVGAGIDTNGVSFAYATSTSSSRTAGTDIVTRDFIPNDTRIVHTSGDETITGVKTLNTLVVTAAGNLRKTDDTHDLWLCSGTANTTTNGAYIGLYASSNSGSYPGVFQIVTGKVNNKYAAFIGKPDGTLTWNGKNVATTDSDITGKSANVTGTVAIANGGTGATTRLNAFKNLTNSNVGASPTHFVTFTSSWATAGYSSVANVKTALGLKSAAYTESSDYVQTSGDQTIAGSKTFSATSYHNVNQVFKYTFTHGTNPSAWTHRSIYFSDKTGGEATTDLIGMVRSSIGTNGATRMQISAVQNVNTSPVTATLDVNANADGLIYATCPLIRPATNNTYSCGTASYKWTQIYATSGNINTSDERLKSSISSVPDAVLDAWDDVNWSQFQFNDAVAEKGIDKARIHNGLIAQRIDTVFKAHGLDASRYGLFCYDKWDAIPEEKDEEGNVVIPATEAGDAYSLRYEEALCMEAAYQRRRADRAEARITALEEEIAKIKSLLEVK